MIQHLIGACENVFGRIVVVVGPEMPTLEDAVAPREVVVQRERLGTGHAALQAAPLLGGHQGDVAVLYGDNPLISAATLQALVWVAVARWLMQCGAAGRGVAWIAPLGVVAGIALVVYGSFLGTEGPIYRWLRQYGTVVYFGFTCLNLLLTGNAVQALVRVRRLFMPRWLEHAMVALASTLVLLGLGNALVAAAFGEPLKGRVENVTEWWGALIFVLGFCAIAAMWWRERVVLRLGVSPR